jgi:hypothetical protein
VNTLGQTIFSQGLGTMSSGIHSSTIDISKFPVGVYQVLVSSETGNSQKKIIIVK